MQIPNSSLNKLILWINLKQHFAPYDYFIFMHYRSKQIYLYPNQTQTIKFTC